MLGKVARWRPGGARISVGLSEKDAMLRTLEKARQLLRDRRHLVVGVHAGRRPIAIPGRCVIA